MQKDIFAVSPLKFQDDIPVFSELNEYIENYDKISSDHLTEAEVTGKNPFMDEARWTEIEESTMKLIFKYAPNGGKILDVGVGTGRLLDKLPNTFEKYGMDISLQYLQHSKKKGINVSMSLIEDMPYRTGLFDMVVCTDVLEHVLDLNLAASKILQVLKPDGKLIIRVPYKENLKPYITAPYKYVHLRNFDEYSLILFFEKIMPCKTLEYTTSGGAITRNHLYSYSPNIFKMGFMLFIHFFKFINVKMWRKLANMFYPPSVINIVLEKCAA